MTNDKEFSTDRKDNMFKNIGFVIFVSVVCVCSNLSQLPLLIGSEVAKFTIITMWTLLGGVLFVIAQKNKILHSYTSFILVVSIWFGFIVAIMELLTPGLYFASSMLYPFYLSIFVFIVGYKSAVKITTESFKVVIWAYAISSAAVAISIYLIAFQFYSGLDSRAYLYASKNSVSQIIFTAVIFILIMFKPKKFVIGVGKYLVILLLVGELLLLRSRATIICIPLLLVVIILFDVRKQRIWATLALLSLLIFVLSNQTFYDLNVNSVLLGGRSIDNLNDISSGRVSMAQSFFPAFSQHIWFGSGGSKEIYIESFPLSALVQHGIIGATPLLLMAVLPLYYGIKLPAKLGKWKILLIAISATYLLNGLFEELTPFGPGVKNYMLWFLFGLLVGWNKLEKTIRRQDGNFR